MICEEDEHDWKIAWENPYYSIAEVTCEKCGLVFQLNIPHGNGHNGHDDDITLDNIPGYRAEQLRKAYPKGVLIPTRKKLW